MRLVLSPMPPVLCLSTRMGDPVGQCRLEPLCSMAWVSAAVSSVDMPLKKIAIASALIW